MWLTIKNVDRSAVQASEEVLLETLLDEAIAKAVVQPPPHLIGAAEGSSGPKQRCAHFPSTRAYRLTLHMAHTRTHALSGRARARACVRACVRVCAITCTLLACVCMRLSGRRRYAVAGAEPWAIDAAWRLEVVEAVLEGVLCAVEETSLQEAQGHRHSLDLQVCHQPVIGCLCQLLVASY
jgi:hypothetical protein